MVRSGETRESRTPGGMVRSAVRQPPSDYVVGGSRAQGVARTGQAVASRSYRSRSCEGRRLRAAHRRMRSGDIRLARVWQPGASCRGPPEGYGPFCCPGNCSSPMTCCRQIRSGLRHQLQLQHKAGWTAEQMAAADAKSRRVEDRRRERRGECEVGCNRAVQISLSRSSASSDQNRTYEGSCAEGRARRPTTNSRSR